MTYVYILQSPMFDHFYVGITDDLRARLRKHNAGQVSHTAKYAPWRLETLRRLLRSSEGGRV